MFMFICEYMIHVLFNFGLDLSTDFLSLFELACIIPLLRYIR